MPQPMSWMRSACSPIQRAIDVVGAMVKAGVQARKIGTQTPPLYTTTTPTTATTSTTAISRRTTASRDADKGCDVGINVVSS